MRAPQDSEDINPNTNPDLLLQVKNQELYTTPDRMLCFPLDSAVSESVLIVKGFNSQELNIFLPSNSMSVTEGPRWSAALGFGAVKEAAGPRGTELSIA